MNKHKIHVNTLAVKVQSLSSTRTDLVLPNANDFKYDHAVK